MDTRTSFFTHSLKNQNDVNERATSELRQVWKKKKNKNQQWQQSFLELTWWGEISEAKGERETERKESLALGYKKAQCSLLRARVWSLKESFVYL